MTRHTVMELKDCTLLRESLAAQPPAIVHGTALLLIALLGAAVTWSIVVQANLVVRAKGRVRTIATTTRVFTDFGSELNGRVVDANVEEGITVRRGDILARLDTKQLDNRLESLDRSLTAVTSELRELAILTTLLDQKYQVAEGKAQAELRHAEGQLQRAQQQRTSELRRSESQLEMARDRLRRYQQLGPSAAVARMEVVEAEAMVRQAEEQVVQAQLPVDEEQVQVMQRALDLVHKEFDIRRSEMRAQQATKEGEAERLRKEIAHLRLQREAAVVKAPIDGVVVSGRIRTGDVLESGKAVLELAPQQGHRFEAYVSSKDAGLLQVGMPVRIKFDAYDYQKYGTLAGKVTYISPDSNLVRNGEQNAEASYEVRIELEGEQVARGKLVGRVKLGLEGTAEIVTGRERLLAILIKQIRQSISLG